MHAKMEAELAHKQQLMRDQEELATKLREKERSLDSAKGQYTEEQLRLRAEFEANVMKAASELAESQKREAELAAKIAAKKKAAKDLQESIELQQSLINENKYALQKAELNLAQIEEEKKAALERSEAEKEQLR
jgi:chromosome segregation ATPase